MIQSFVGPGTVLLMGPQLFMPRHVQCPFFWEKLNFNFDWNFIGSVRMPLAENAIVDDLLLLSVV